MGLSSSPLARAPSQGVVRENGFVGRLQLTCGSRGTIRRLTSFGFRPDDGRNGVAAGTAWVKADSARAFASATWLRFAMIQSDE